MKSYITKIEEKLKTKFESMNEPISIRNIVAYQVPSLKGEYKVYANTRIAQETEQQLIDRIVKQIIEFAEIANEQHLKDNFIAGEMDSTKLNAITRLSLPEFSFYPHASRGPLSIEGYTVLMEKLTQLASTYKNNLHLLIGTIPVKMPNHVLKNMASYIECGDHPRIHNFAKAMPYATDPNYTDIANESFSGELIESEYQIGFMNLIDKLQTQFLSSDFKAGAKTIGILKEILTKHIIVGSSKRLLDQLESIEKQIQKNNYDKNQMNMDINEFINSANTISMEVSNQIHEIVSHMPDAAIGNDDSKVPAIAYNGNFIIQTQGGAQARINIDICLDQHHGVAKMNALREIDSAIKNSESRLPEQASSIIISDSIVPNSKQTISTSITHADPIESKSKKSVQLNNQFAKLDSTRVKSNCLFGKKFNVDIYSRQPIGQHTPEVTESIKKHNAKMNRLEALRFAQINQVPKNSAEEMNKNLFNKLKEINVMPNTQLASPQSSTLSQPAFKFSTFNNDKQFCSLSDNPDSELKTSAANLRCTPPSLMVTLTLFSVFVPYIPSFGSFLDKPRSLADKDREFLNNVIQTLLVQQNNFKKAKEKRAYAYQINLDKYNKVDNVFYDTKNLIEKILKENRITSFQINEIKKNVRWIDELVPTLTNKHLEKELRKHEIKQDRYMRRKAI